ncbi:sulfotransferase [Pseudidiomarina sp. 1APR75-33.1]|uniref:tetratricopeptide repeat-containing sulfotransferase family protein n=1 Tax=Pseudidiomarina terrestris TaxID=2820060 RepID=UPI00264BDA1B|nr:tetratricopeptide repeat-containing sulfotransferase family protein [Pseudidiomarina sp. 1APR75-33.1]MDN7126857.1 sulfotransferase [Pseudidiomarina sp. 1APR75-33.1]
MNPAVARQFDALCQRLAASPQRLELLDEAAALAVQQGDQARAATLYLDYIAHHQRHAGAQFNCGYYCRAAGLYPQAIAHYQRALELGISQPEEVYTNIGVIYNEGLLQNDNAIAAFQEALRIAPGYVPALYNLANCYEQNGDKKQAAHYFSRVIHYAPNFAMAYVRLADVHRAETSADPLIAKLQQLVTTQRVPLNERIDAAYALGKLCNDCGAYAEAWQYYQQANQWNATTMPAWDETRQRALLQSLQVEFNQPLPRATVDADAAQQPVFVCGMFRSGSTLLEQMLGGHSAISSGGELEFFPRLWQRIQAQGDGGLRDYLAQQRDQDFVSLGRDYLAFVRERLGDVRYFTDKRPDSIWLLGLIKRALPQAKFIVTRRHPLDNALSVYFTRLGSSMAYANRFEDILCYIELENDLLRHWQQVLGDDLQVVNYDQLVAAPQQQLEPVLAELGLDWQESCLDFHRRNNSVRTASVWQVRQPLYQSSSGRWRNYADFLPELPELPKQP